MFKGPFLLALALLLAAGSMGLTIDDFSVNLGQTVLVTVTTPPGHGQQLVGGSASFTPGCGGGLIGCGRDLRVEFSEVSAGSQFHSDIVHSSSSTFPDEWRISVPKGGSSIFYSQYDGNDPAFDKILLTGLGTVDLTQGNATGFRIYGSSDPVTNLVVDIYDTDGLMCRGSTQTSEPQVQFQKDLPFSSFSGSCNISRAGALEVMIVAKQYYQASIYKIVTAAVNVPFPTPTPVPSPGTTGFLCCYYWNPITFSKTRFCASVSDGCPTFGGFYLVNKLTAASCSMCPDENE